jgi:hypothetical protein
MDGRVVGFMTRNGDVDVDLRRAFATISRYPDDAEGQVDCCQKEKATPMLGMSGLTYLIWTTLKLSVLQGTSLVLRCLICQYEPVSEDKGPRYEAGTGYNPEPDDVDGWTAFGASIPINGAKFDTFKKKAYR